MDEFVSKKLLVAKFNELASKYIDGDKRQRGLAYTTAADMIALADAADVQPVDRWISVDDELPKEWYEVLAYSEMGKIEKAIYVNGRWKLTAFLGETVEDVTHWQPLPEPPKEGEHND